MHLSINSSETRPFNCPYLSVPDVHFNNTHTEAMVVAGGIADGVG